MLKSRLLNRPRIGILSLGIYGAALLWFSTLRPLWLDEVLQVSGVLGRSPAEILHWASVNRGGVPLGYLSQSAFLSLCGFSETSARMPAVIFGVLSVFAVVRLAGALRLAKPYVAGAVFAAIPIQVRYATEARPYSQALFFAVLSTYFAVRYCNERNRAILFGYGLAVLAGLYSQPNSAFVAAAHVMWALWRPKPSRRDAALLAAAAGAAAVLFLPWLWFAGGNWAGRDPGSGAGFAVAQVRPLMFVREISGAGYAGGLALLGTAVLAFLNVRSRRCEYLLLGLCVAVPLAAVPLANWAFDYFMAIRQVIYVLPALAVLSAEAITALDGRRRIIGISMAVVLVISALAANLRWFGSSPREDWRAAAELAWGALPPTGCITVPGGLLENYALFRPELRLRDCTGREHSEVLVAANPYAPPEQVAAIRRELDASGLRCARVAEAGGTRFLLYRRGPVH